MRWSGTDRPVLVIGYGNSLRRDDGAGLVLAGALVDQWREHDLPAALLTAHQLNPELAEDIAQSGAGIVVFVDAEDAQASTGALVELAQVYAEYMSPSLGHHLTPAVVILYARQLYAFRGSAWIISVPGYDFAHGEGLSEATQTLVDNFLAGTNAVWQELHTTRQSNTPND